MEQEGVLIVGGGPVGLTTAWLLAEGGIPVTVLEKVAEVQKDYRASTFHAATLDLTRRMRGSQKSGSVGGRGEESPRAPRLAWQAEGL